MPAAGFPQPRKSQLIRRAYAPAQMDPDINEIYVEKCTPSLRRTDLRGSRGRNAAFAINAHRCCVSQSRIRPRPLPPRVALANPRVK